MGLGGYYYVNKVSHFLSRDGYETELQCKYSISEGSPINHHGDIVPTAQQLQVTSTMQCIASGEPIKWHPGVIKATFVHPGALR